ncbi:transcriptional regulator [Lactobacillus nasalidis]|uniref:Transcriptional regulator n=1 Tax=Lactobacillus nasalidis TaxID=2797258 RepID=A0ABQ3W9G9_9LACO|nr:DeoR/GlpR family DNA-binding transcription regulator [Lactobacillus nasalidis]GHV97039.1 transcriptional regulator [Lactobacillus nasalidis]GHW00268.1 transcriptional regulator [Lactobacillus nasalidis]GHW01734.1 transcriptional regulator [Lactobacillus nasalidis]
MTQENRLKEIRRLLLEKRELKTREIANYFGISFDTARRDVLRLTETGQALRIHGGLMAIDDNSVPSFLTRQHILSPVKRDLAEVASQFVHAGQCDFIGPSTTLNLLCQRLGGQDLTVVTNSIDNVLALLPLRQPAVKLLGGDVDKANRFTHSPQALDALRQFHFNTAFIGAARVDADGSYLIDASDADVIQLATSKAQRVVLVTEKHKFVSKVTAPFQSAPLDRIDVVITDAPLDDATKKLFSPKTRLIHL